MLFLWHFSRYSVLNQALRNKYILRAMVYGVLDVYVHIPNAPVAPCVQRTNSGMSHRQVMDNCYTL